MIIILYDFILFIYSSFITFYFSPLNVRRSWAFTQKDIIQEFRTDDNISYWYHRLTGQTFWERPLLEDEIVHPLKGGTLLDMNHDELPSTIVKGVEGLEPRLNQGELRKFMNKHHENDKDALKRRKRVAALAPLARDQGLIPGVDKIDLEGNITTLLTGEVDKPNGVEMSREGGRGRGVGKGVHTVGEGSGAQLGYSSHSAIDTLSAYSIVPNEVEEEDRGFGSGSGTKKSKLSTERWLVVRTSVQ